MWETTLLQAMDGEKWHSVPLAYAAHAEHGGSCADMQDRARHVAKFAC
jgi:hypothetical protein